MKKIVYSGVTKFIAVILFIASIVLGTLCVTDGLIEYFDEETEVYYFENDFSESSYVSHLLDEPENVIFLTYHSLYYNYNEYGEIDRDTSALPDNETVEQNLRERFDNFYYSDRINYYVQWNDAVFTNCNATSPEELMEGEYYSYIKRHSSGSVERTSTHNHHYYLLEELYQFDDESTIVISCNIKKEVVDEYKSLWEKQQSIVLGAITQALICVAVALVALIYLLAVCGKNKDGELKNMWLDNIWTEIHLAAAGGSGVGAVIVGAVLLDDYFSGHFAHKLIYWIMGSAALLASIIIITSLLSIIRNIKRRRFIESSIIFLVLRWVFKTIFRILRWLRNGFIRYRNLLLKTLSKKTGVILISMLFAYTALIGLFGVFTLEAGNPFWIFVGIALFGVASFFVAQRAKDIDEIKKGVSEVRNGNVAYKIPELKCEDMRALAVNINDIAKGLDESVSAKVKAERMKTELITNVSHDLKTPITSIISYTELLSQIEDLPEEARDYVSVISKKSDRLKNLTQDLFDISKVQSGNEDVVLEKLDVSLLINQSLGEHDNEIQSSDLPFFVEAPKELYIAADGRKMSRVVSNLINNILKYTMKNTRVFITASEKGGNVVIEFKNIASYPMNFSADEITQRFVRGDESRTAEGNGLGLAIAKSYTEICNGKFDVVVDGDMFKVILTFRKYS